jgi:hypothetical protein
MYVDLASSSGDGTVTAPFRTIKDAIHFAEEKSWNSGIELRIASGSYTETPEFALPMKVTINGSGKVIIGE